MSLKVHTCPSPARLTATHFWRRARARCGRGSYRYKSGYLAFSASVALTAW